MFNSHKEGQDIDTNAQVQDLGPSSTPIQRIIKVLQSNLEMKKIMHWELSQQLGELCHALEIARLLVDPKSQ
jgi:hypothetical protein